jgi:hypothetical protein
MVGLGAPCGALLQLSLLNRGDGRMVEVRTKANREISLPIGNLPRGRYLFELRGAGMKVVKAFAIKP